MEKEENWALANSHNYYSLKTKEIIIKRVEEEAAAEEELSLCDLPIIHHQFVKETREREKVKAIQEPQQDFDFCSLSIESKMCPADELFSQGQFLPLRHYVSSEMGLSLQRNGSMDNCYSDMSISCRSSSSSTINPRRRHLNPPRNQFHSYPSPSPRILRPNTKPGLTLNSTGYMNNPSTKISVWRIFRRGLVSPPPEIAFQDLENRNKTNCYNFGGRNSSATKNGKSEKKKIRKSNPRLLNGCKCSDNDAVPTTVVIIRRRANDSEEESVKLMKDEENKKRLSYRRTFEWLKQLSIECSEDDDEA